jgi:hypothetical protein
MLSKVKKMTKDVKQRQKKKPRMKGRGKCESKISCDKI